MSFNSYSSYNQRIKNCCKGDIGPMGQMGPIGPIGPIGPTGTEGATGPNVIIGSDICGIPGSVLFVGPSGELDEDNLGFFWNDSSNYLGIGTNNPIDSLHIMGVIDQNIRIETTPIFGTNQTSSLLLSNFPFFSFIH